MAIPLPQGAVLDRFRRDLAAVGADEALLAVALSGGADSLALLLLAAAARPGAVQAATVDHGLREASASEAAFAAGVCARLGVPHATLRATVAAGGAGLQGEARRARYAALAEWMEGAGLATLLTGHHADDQAETLLMRLNRGSGVGGLAGVRARGPLPESGGRLTVARPLLGWRRAELAEIVRAAGLEAVQDPSNADARFDRVRIRGHLAEAGWIDVAALARSAAALAEAEEALDAVAARLFDERWTAPVLDASGLPAELQRRLVLRAVQAVAPQSTPRGEQVGALLVSLSAGETGTLAGVKCVGGAVWRFETARPRRGD